MRYYVAYGPIFHFGYKWDVSYYKMSSDREADIIRVQDDTITVEHIFYLNPIYVSKYCKEITQEEYESILGL